MPTAAGEVSLVARRVRLAIVVAAGIGVALRAAPAQEAVRAAPVNLMAAVARTAAEPGWRVEPLADGRLAAIGVSRAGEVTQVIGIACGTSHRPEVAVDARGAVSMPRAFVIEAGGRLAAIPIAPSGASTQGADALLDAIAVTPDGALDLALDDRAFPTGGAREALEPVWKQCEQLFGWRITDPDPQQLVWSYVPGPSEPTLAFKGPRSDAVAAAIACDPNRGAVTLRVADLVRAGRRPQPLRFTLEASGESFTIAGQAVAPGLATGTLAAPDRLLGALADAARITVRARAASVTLPAQVLRILLPHFRHACALP